LSDQSAATDLNSAPTVSVVVPTLNEADNIDQLLGEIKKSLTGQTRFEVIVVDDASSDGTPDRAQAWANRIDIQVIRRDAPPDLSALHRPNEEKTGPPAPPGGFGSEGRWFPPRRR